MGIEKKLVEDAARPVTFHTRNGNQHISIINNVAITQQAVNACNSHIPQTSYLKTAKFRSNCRLFCYR